MAARDRDLPSDELVDHPVNELGARSLSRRQFLAGLGVIGISASVATLLAACGGSAATPLSSSGGSSASSTAPAAAGGTSATDTTVAATPKTGAASPAAAGATKVTRSGGRLIASTAQSPSSLDPAFGINEPEYAITSWLYDNLVWLSPDLELKPMLATKWSADSAAKVWTFQLRDDVKFTNGDKLTADDVVWSISRILNPDTGSPGRSGVGPIDKVEAKDPQTVVFSLKSSYADFPLELTQRWGRIIAKDTPADQLKTNAVGSGPFVLKEYVPGSHVLAAHNPDHWDPNAGLVDEIMYRIIPDQVAELTALQNGETHIMSSVPVASYDQLKKNDNVVISEVPTGNWFPMIMRVDTKPFDNPKVRQAIKYCIDRNQFVAAVVQGHGTPANDQNVPPNHPFAWNGPLRQRDIAKAKSLLAEAGLPNGFSFDVIAATDRSIRADTAVTIQEMVKDAGIKFNVKTIDYNTYIAQVYKKGPCYIGSWGMRPTLDSQMTPFFTTGGSFNEYAYSNKDLDDTLAAARGELDADKRKALYQKAQQILSDDGPALIAFFQNVISAYRKNVVGFKAHPLTQFDLRYVSLKS